MNFPRPAGAPHALHGVDAVPVFLEAVEALRPPTPAVIVEHPDHLPVEADPALLATLLHHLVSEAIRSAADRAEIRLVLGARPGCSLYVADNGIGTEPAQAGPAPFPPGAPTAGARPAEGASGLAAATRIVAGLGGRAWAQSEPGWGTTVFVALAPARD